jgi:hypothetical protein
MRAQYLFDRFAGCQLFQDQFDSDARPGNDRFAHQHVRV